MEKLTDPWFREKTYGQGLPMAIREALSASAHERDAALTRACIMAAMYERDKYYGTRFGNGPQTSLMGALNIGQSSGSIMDDKSVPGINKIKAAIDVQTDTILKQLPTLSVRVANARFEDMRQNEIRSAVLNHSLQAPQTKGALYLWTRDGLIKREAFVRWQFLHGKMHLQRFHPWQVFYDSRDAEDGHLSQVHTVQLVDRDEFLSWYRQAKQADDKGKAQSIPNHSTRVQEIDEVPRAQNILPFHAGFRAMWCGAHRWLVDNTDTISDQIRVVWSWKRAWRDGEPTGRVVCTVLADGDGNGRGKSVVAIDMPFSRSTLPVVHWSPWQADQGIAGISLAEQLIGTQMCIDRTLYKLQRLQDKYGHPKLLVPEDTPDDVIKAMTEQGVSPVRLGTETAPAWAPGLQMNQNDIAWLNFLLDRPSAEQGISPNLTQGVSQLGPSASGVARVEEALRSVDRQQGVRDAWGRGFLNVGHEHMNAVDDALTIDPNFSASWPQRGRLVSRKWAKLTRPTGDYTLDLVPRGTLGDTPAGQLQQAQELAAQGLLSQDALAEFVAGIPDLEGAMRRQTAPRRLIQHHLAILVDPDTTEEQAAEVQPSEDMDLADAAFMVTAELQLARANDAKPETIIRLESYLLAVGAVTQSLAARAAPAPPPVSGLGAEGAPIPHDIVPPPV